MRFIIALILLVGSQTADAQLFRNLFGGSRGVTSSNYYNGTLAWGRWCNSGSCGMCNRIEAHNRALAAQRQQAQTFQTVAQTEPPPENPSDYRIEYRTETYTVRVKHCNGRRCWYENETRTRQVPVRVPVTRSIVKAGVPDPFYDFTPDPVIDEALKLLDVQDKTLYDLGCGDGRVLRKAMEEYHAKGVGFELDRSTFDIAKANLDSTKGGWRLYNQDVKEAYLGKADAVYVYLIPPVLESIRWDTLKPGTRVLSYGHDLPGLETERITRTINGEDHVFYLHEAEGFSWSGQLTSTKPKQVTKFIFD